LSIKFLILLPLLFGAVAALAQSYTISGSVVDKERGETLIGATVLDSRSKKGTVTDINGRFSLTLRADSVNLRVSYVGYAPEETNLQLEKNVTFHFQLKPSVELKEVVITAERVNDVKSSQMSAYDVPIEQIKSIPVLFGEADIVKAIQLLPGVQSGNEGSSGMYVRGGGPDENLFLLDGVALYNVNHMGGFFSAFNTDAVKNVTLYKGSFPARFGGRLSSVLDVTANNGNNQQLHGNLSVGLISAKFSLEGPIVKERTTFNLSARRTYADLFLVPLIKKLSKSADDETVFKAGYYFYDINAKLTHKFSDKSRLFASFYMGSDYIYAKVRTMTSLNEDQYMGSNDRWGNILGAIRWNYALTPKIFMNATLSYTRYTNSLLGNIEKTGAGSANTSNITGQYDSGIQDLTARVDFTYMPNPSHDIKFGTYYTHHWFTPEVMKGEVNYFDQLQMNDTLKVDTTSGDNIIPADEFVLFAEDDWSITDMFKINYGLHLSGFRVQNSFYPSIQPRVSGRLMIIEDLSFKFGYAYMSQYMHLLSTTGISLPTDLWLPVTDRIAPMKAHQVAAGLFYSWSGIADFSIEGYYKHMSNLLEYKDGVTLLGSPADWENMVVIGDGWAYGVEFLVQRSVGKFTGWIGYTWSRTMHQFNREGMVLNNGHPFPAKYDRRHDVSIVLSYKFNKKIDVSATWVFSTGNALTLAMQRYPQASDNPDDYNETSSDDLSYISSRNNFRMPNYHRLDIGANFHRVFKNPRLHRTISVSVYNVYNRKNPYMLYVSNTRSYNGYPSALMQLSLFPILPSVAYTFYF
jgi:outer membrane cobalamin receptor